MELANPFQIEKLSECQMSDLSDSIPTYYFRYKMFSLKKIL